MLRTLFFTLFIIISGTSLSQVQDTVAGWTFPSGEPGDKYCDLGIGQNVGTYDLRATNKDDMLRELSFPSNESQDNYFAEAVRWEEGKDYKYWMVRFEAAHYKDLTINSRQRSDGVKPGPRDFAIEYKLGSSGNWTRLDSVVVENNWTSGLVENLEMPEISDTYPNVISLRWIMISDSSAYASEVLEDGRSWIDDIIITGTYVEPNPQPIIAGWTFPTFMSDHSADTSTAENADYQLELINDDTGEPEPYNLSSGFSTFAASSKYWQNQANSRYWMVKVNTEDYKDINFSSRQSGRAQNPGPSSFKVQYRVGGGEWADIEDAEVQVDDTWFTGVLSNVPLPEVCWDTTASIYLRWLSTSNVDFNGNSLSDDDVSIIDDLIIRGTDKTVGTEELSAPDQLTIAPIPATSHIMVQSTDRIGDVDIYNLQGARVIHESVNNKETKINITGLHPGIYMVSVLMNNGYRSIRKVMVY